MRELLLAGILCLLPSLVRAQENEGDTIRYQHPTVLVVGASRLPLPLASTPFPVTLVGGWELRELPRSVALDEPLKLVPGVKADNQANGSRIHLSIRGQGILSERGIRGIKVLLDGIPLNDPTGFTPDVYDCNYNAVSYIEVLRGPAASLYGGSASGGIITMATTDPPTRQLGGNAAVTAGSNGFWKTDASVGGTYKNIGIEATAARMMGDGYRDHTHFQGTNLYLKALYEEGRSLFLRPIFAWTDYTHENPEGITLAQYRQDDRMANPDAVPYNEFLHTDRFTIGTTGALQLDWFNNLSFAAYMKYTRFTEANNRTFTHRNFKTPGGTLQYTWKTGEPREQWRSTLTAGVDAQWQTIDEFRTVNNRGVETAGSGSSELISQSSLGLFAAEQITLMRRFGVMLSLRYDEWKNKVTDYELYARNYSGERNFSRVTGRLGMTYEVSEALTLFADWGQGFLPPATEELVQNPDNLAGFNTRLSPATSESFELGSRGTVHLLLYKPLRYEAAGFFMTTKNDFDRYRISDPLRSQETFYRNAASSRRAGLELGIEGELLPELSMQAAYTYSHFLYTNAIPLRIMMDDTTVVKYIRDGNRLPNSPDHQLMVKAEYLLAPGLSFGVSTETFSTSYIDGANIEREAVPGFTLVHAFIQWDNRIAGMFAHCSFHVRNLANRTYIAFTEPDPGGNSYQPGSRREFFGKVSIEF